MAEPKMLTAIHPFRRKIITPKEFISEFGVNYKEENIFPNCLHCGETVFTYGTSSIEVTSRFKHFSGKSCNTAPIGGGNHPGFNFSHGEMIKKEFCKPDVISKSYALCLSMIGRGNFPINIFLDLCKKADRKNIWSYVDVEVWMIPYMLLTLNDFTLTSQNKKTFQIRFVLDKNFDVLSKEKDCNIEKIYTNSQNLIKSFSVSKRDFQDVKIEWMNQSLIDKLTSYCC